LEKKQAILPFRQKQKRTDEAAHVTVSGCILLDLNFYNEMSDPKIIF
jgi:hypothetical protein